MGFHGEVFITCFKIIFSKTTFGRTQFSVRPNKSEEVAAFLKAEVHLTIPNVVSYVSYR